MDGLSSKRFTIGRRVGEGGMGVVYEAFDAERRSSVALKTLRRVDGASLARFKREFRAVQGLAHPNLVVLDELFHEDGQWFFTMELLDGVDFVSHVRATAASVAYASTLREGPAPPENGTAQEGATVDACGPIEIERLRVALRQLLEGLVALHAANKVHRDIKPSNVLVTREGRVVLLDFGLVTEASVEDRSTGSAIVGTPIYMAPEQAASREIGPAADLYAVGVMLYELLAGRPPFEGLPLQILLDKQKHEAPLPSGLNPQVPPDLDALCGKLLRFDPTTRPSAADVLRTLSAPDTASTSAARGSTEPPMFVGRAAELAQLRAAFDAVPKSGLVTVLVCGASGIGKSHTIRQFNGQLLLEDPGLMLLEGRCYEREAVPYKALDGIVDALSRQLSRMSAPEVAAVLPTRAALLTPVFPAMLRVAQLNKQAMPPGPAIEPQEQRQRAFLALRDLFTRLALRRRTVVVIDDLQWADDDGLRALAEILRAPDAPPLLLIGTLRVGRDAKAGDFERIRAATSGDVRVIELANLNHEESRELAIALLQRSATSGADPDSIASEAGGHPLFVEELTRHAALGGETRGDVNLDDAIWSRVTRLEPATREMAELVAIAGKPVPQEVIAAAAHFDPTEFTRRAAILRVSNLVRTGGTRWADAIEPYHDRVREAVLAQLDPARRRALHEALAIAFEASSSRLDPETLATHWHEAGNDRRAAAHAIAAGDQATRTFAFERAAQWFEWAVAWLPGDDPNRRTLQTRVGEALANAGRGVLAAKHFEAAASGAPPMQALDLRRRAAEELLSAGRFDEGDEALRSVLDAVGIDLPRTSLTALFGLLLYRFLLLVRGLRFRERSEDDVSAHALTRLDACSGVGQILALVDTIRGAYFQTRALLAALAVGEPNRVAHALSAEAVYLGTSGNAARSAILLERAQAIGARTGNMRVQAFTEASVWLSTFGLGRFRSALEHCDHAATMLRNCPGAWLELRAAQLSGVWTVAWLGELAELARRVEQGIREAQVRGDIYAGTALRTGVPNLVWLRTGDVSSSRAAAQDAMGQWTQRGYHAQHYWSLLALTRADLYEGSGDAAHQRVAREWSQIVRALIPQVRIMGVEALHLRGSAALGAAAERQGTARMSLIRAAERDARSLRRSQWALGTALASAVDAGAAMLRGDLARAAQELDAGRRGFAALDMRLHAAAGDRHVGTLRGGDEGRALVERADAWMAAQGIVSPAAMASMITPGFARGGQPS